VSVVEFGSTCTNAGSWRGTSTAKRISPDAVRGIEPTGVFGDATELRDDPGGARRVVKQELPEGTLGLGGLELGVRAPIGQPRLWQGRRCRWGPELRRSAW
jgi:hypothetical protein